MKVCLTCACPIKETVIEDRKPIARVPAGPHVPPGTARYLTVLSLMCACGKRRERRYENLRTVEYLTR